ncbi:MAG TPA: ActD-like protein [Polyangia bacterium]
MNGKDKVPDWLLERLAHNDLPEAEAARVRARLATEPDGAARLEQLRQSDEAILRELPPAVVAAEVKRRLATAAPRPARRPWVLPVLALGAVGAIAIVAVRPKQPTGTPGATQEEIEITGIKGHRPQILVYRKKSDHRADRLAGGATVRPSDVLQVAYVAAGRRFGVIVSLDARGTVTPHLPEALGPAVTLTTQGETALPHAYELDDSPGFERFVFVTADNPFHASDVVESLRPGAAPLSKDFHVTELTLRKETP